MKKIKLEDLSDRDQSLVLISSTCYALRKVLINTPELEELFNKEFNVSLNEAISEAQSSQPE